MSFQSLTIKPTGNKYKVTLVSSTGKIFNWHVLVGDFVSIEMQAIAYEGGA